jgi:superfamily I DNA/RNA helicase
LYGEFPTTIETNDQAIEVYDILSEFWKHKLMHHDFATGSINVPVKKWEYKTVVLYAYRAVLNFVDDPNKSVVVNILHETSEALYNEVVNKVKNNAVKEYDKEIKSRLWRQFYTMQNQFAEVGYDYALTVHKSQGSTYKNCLVHKWDINTNPKPAEKKSLTYVAVTRAKENLYVVG